MIVEENINGFRINDVNVFEFQDTDGVFKTKHLAPIGVTSLKKNPFNTNGFSFL